MLTASTTYWVSSVFDEPVAKPAHKRANGGRKNNNETAMINNVAASTSLGDIDALAKLKAQMEGKA